MTSETQRESDRLLAQAKAKRLTLAGLVQVGPPYARFLRRLPLNCVQWFTRGKGVTRCLICGEAVKSRSVGKTEHWVFTHGEEHIKTIPQAKRDTVAVLWAMHTEARTGTFWTAVGIVQEVLTREEIREARLMFWLPEPHKNSRRYDR